MSRSFDFESGSAPVEPVAAFAQGGAATHSYLPSILMLMVVVLLGALIARDQMARRREADIERRLNNLVEGYTTQRSIIRQSFTNARELTRLHQEVAALRSQLANLPPTDAPADADVVPTSIDNTEIDP